MIHLLALASHRGVVLRGPMIGRQQAYVLVRDWLGPLPPFDRDRALAELARRFLAGHAPADDRDLAKWAGLPLRDARAGLRAIASELVKREDGLLEPRAGVEIPELPPPRLLGAFDPLLLGWTSREFVVAAEHASQIVSGGLFRPFALVGGRAVARWRLDSGSVEIEPFGGLAGAVADALSDDARDVLRFLG